MGNWGEVRWRIPIDHLGGEGLTGQQCERPPAFTREYFLREGGNKLPERIAMNPKLRTTERPHDVVCRGALHGHHEDLPSSVATQKAVSRWIER
jgi:hypothetical protein